MFSEYHRPKTIEDALALLGREEPLTVPLAGGTALNARPRRAVLPQGAFAVVDLQDLGLDSWKPREKTLTMGAMVRLQRLLEDGAEVLPPALLDAVRREANYTLRHQATVAGSLVAADGRSPFALAMMALDASLTLLPQEEALRLGDLYPLRWEQLRGRLITTVTVPLNARLAVEMVGRTPMDLPLVAVAVARWPSGRTRVVVGGWGDAPRLALDGPEADGVEAAARNAAYEAEDHLASAEYRREMAATLARRCLAQVS